MLYAKCGFSLLRNGKRSQNFARMPDRCGIFARDLDLEFRKRWIFCPAANKKKELSAPDVRPQRPCPSFINVTLKNGFETFIKRYVTVHFLCAAVAPAIAPAIARAVAAGSATGTAGRRAGNPAGTTVVAVVVVKLAASPSNTSGNSLKRSIPGKAPARGPDSCQPATCQSGPRRSKQASERASKAAGQVDGPFNVLWRRLSPLTALSLVLSFHQICIRIATERQTDAWTDRPTDQTDAQTEPSDSLTHERGTIFKSLWNNNVRAHLGASIHFERLPFATAHSVHTER